MIHVGYNVTIQRILASANLCGHYSTVSGMMYRRVRWFPINTPFWFLNYNGHYITSCFLPYHPPPIWLPVRRCTKRLRMIDLVPSRTFRSITMFFPAGPTGDEITSCGTHCADACKPGRRLNCLLCVDRTKSVPIFHRMPQTGHFGLRKSVNYL